MNITKPRTQNFSKNGLQSPYKKKRKTNSEKPNSHRKMFRDQFKSLPQTESELLWEGVTLKGYARINFKTKSQKFKRYIRKFMVLKEDVLMFFADSRCKSLERLLLLKYLDFDFDKVDNKIKVRLTGSKRYQNLTVQLKDTITFEAWKNVFLPFTSENIEEYYSFGDKIGLGTFSVVNSGWRRDFPNQKVAIKTIDMSLLKPKEKELIQEESMIITKLNHPNIIKYIARYEDFKKAFYVFELVEGGDLLDYVIGREKLSEDHARLIMSQLFNVVKYLHNNFIMHRDLKPENIMVKLDPLSGDVINIKLIDFGFATFFDSKHLPDLPCGTLNYAAPEVLLGETYEKSTDLFSCGVILYFL